MTPALKKLTIFGLASGVSRSIMQQTADDSIVWRAAKLAEAGQDAIDACHAKVDNSRMRQVLSKIDAVCKDKETFDITTMLSFLVLGVQDLQYYCKDTRLLDVIERRALWFIKFFDPRLEDEELHADAFDRYSKWISN